VSVDDDAHEAAELYTLVMQTYLATVGAEFSGFL
jgi:hypothetical protein